MRSNMNRSVRHNDITFVNFKKSGEFEIVPPRMYFAKY